jgi:hypothetical protein
VAEDFVWVKRPQAQGADQKVEKAVWFTSGRKASRRVTPEYWKPERAMTADQLAMARA